MQKWKHKCEEGQQKLKYSKKQLYQQGRCLHRTRECFSEKKIKINAYRYIHRCNASIYKMASEQTFMTFLEHQKKGTLVMWTATF